LQVHTRYHHRPVSIPAAPTYPPQRSFKPRRRGLSPTRVVGYERGKSRWGIAVDGPELRFEELFNRPSQPVIDIGFGGGEALVEIAELRPDEHVIGIDVHTPGVAWVLAEIERRGLENVRVVEGDVVDFLDRVPKASLAGVRVFFPDPWPKHRQRNRRLIRRETIDRIVPLLRPGGVLHLATDAADYAAQMRAVCDPVPSLCGGVVARPAWRPVTRYEQRAIDAGRRPIDLIYVESESSASDSSSAPR
jgi:tRNA (guanine-N7-)-methyltransferase